MAISLHSELKSLQISNPSSLSSSWCVALLERFMNKCLFMIWLWYEKAFSPSLLSSLSYFHVHPAFLCSLSSEPFAPSQKRNWQDLFELSFRDLYL